eukprot:11478254-Alexandrium_andersonii.AAC.1
MPEPMHKRPHEMHAVRMHTCTRIWAPGYMCASTSACVRMQARLITAVCCTRPSPQHISTP